MAKKEVKKSIWEQMKEVWAGVWAEYCNEWRELWNDYKTIIGPFIKGTAAYIWQLIAGILAVVSKGLYGCGKVIVEAILEIIKKA